MCFVNEAADEHVPFLISCDALRWAVTTLDGTRTTRTVSSLAVRLRDVRWHDCSVAAVPCSGRSDRKPTWNLPGAEEAKRVIALAVRLIGQALLRHRAHLTRYPRRIGEDRAHRKHQQRADALRL